MPSKQLLLVERYWGVMECINTMTATAFALNASALSNLYVSSGNETNASAVAPIMLRNDSIRSASRGRGSRAEQMPVRISPAATKLSGLPPIDLDAGCGIAGSSQR